VAKAAALIGSRTSAKVKARDIVTNPNNALAMGPEKGSTNAGGMAIVYGELAGLQPLPLRLPRHRNNKP